MFEEPMKFGAAAILILYIVFLLYMNRDYFYIYKKWKEKQNKKRK